MKFSDLLLLSVSNLWKRKLRTVLTVLGVVIGITSIVVMVALGIGLRESVLENISDSASITQIEVNTVGYYSSTDNQEEKRLDDSLVSELLAMEHVTAVYPELSISVIAKTGKYMAYLDLRGVTQEQLAAMKLPVKEGNLPEKENELELFYGNNALLNFYVEKTNVYPYYENNEAPDIDLMNDSMFIIFDTNAYWSSQGGDGTVKAPKKYLVEASGVMEGELGDWSTNYGYYVFCDIDALKTQLKRVFKNTAIPGQPTRKNGKPYSEIFYSKLTVQMDEMENVEALTNTLNDMGYSAYSEAQWIESSIKEMNTIQLVLGAIGAVSLLVAAIGITNTMMMSIYERTKEIGVMKVLGCDIRNIQVLFLLEAGFIGLIGGIVGIGVSYGIGAIINHLVNLSGMGIADICRIPIWLPPVSIVFAIFIGMLAGFLPSLRAMKLSPLAAIRNE